MNKVCISCNNEKPIGDFYDHPKTKDGYSNKCIDCSKSYAKSNYSVKIKNSNFLNKERVRGRIKGRNRINQKQYPESRKKWIDKFPEKRNAHVKAQHLERPFENAHGHHWSYNEADLKSVIWLSSKEHFKAHRFIYYDQERMMYRRCDNNLLLNTKHSHQEYIDDCIKNKPD